MKLEGYYYIQQSCINQLNQGGDSLMITAVFSVSFFFPMGLINVLTGYITG